MTYAIIETGGKQLRVEPGRFYDIELLSAEADDKITIEAVLLVQHNGEVTIGQPLVTGAKVEGTVMRHLRGRKVLVYKMQPKKKTRKKRGHRQEITRLLINSISLNDSVLALEESAIALPLNAEEIIEPTATTETLEVVENSPVAEIPAVEETLEPTATTETLEVAENSPVAETATE